MLVRNDLDVAGRQLSALDSGGSGPVVLFLHNNSGSSDWFRPILVDALIERYRCLAVDFPGHGASPPSPRPAEDYSVPALADLLAVLTERVVSGPCVIVGHSLGGHVAAAALPKLRNVAGLFLISAPPINASSMGAAFLPDPSQGAIFAGSLADAGVDQFATALLGVGRVSDSLSALVRDSIRKTDVSFRPTLLASIMAGRLADERAHIESTRVPTCFVFGKNDPFLQTSYFGGLSLATPFAGGRHCFESSGHCPHLDSPQQVSGLLQQFLQDAFAGANPAGQH
jgi:pimeloyl-ACP methyl ester carboxylesterase